MNAVIIEHVKISELPAAWRAKLPSPENAHVTVRIEEETAVLPLTPAEELNSLTQQGHLANGEPYPCTPQSKAH